MIIAIRINTAFNLILRCKLLFRYKELYFHVVNFTFLIYKYYLMLNTQIVHITVTIISIQLTNESLQ